MREDPLDLIGDVLDGQFRVDEFAGEGDFSLVYRGHHLGVDAPVAIKCLDLPTTLDPKLLDGFLESFREGARIHYRLAQGHLHVAQSIAVGTTVAPRTGVVVPYMIREWLEGRSLAADLAARAKEALGPRPVVDVVHLLDSAADALAFAHAQGVVHHSINPKNLFVVMTMSGPVVKLLDFGVARVMNHGSVATAALDASGNLQTGLRVLLPTYAAPEQLDRSFGAPCAATDVYAFAILVYETLAGRPLLPDTTLAADVLRAYRREPRPSAKSIGVRIPSALELVLKRALSLEPSMRQANAGDFWHDVKAAIGEVPRPPGPYARRASIPTAPRISSVPSPPPEGGLAPGAPRRASAPDGRISAAPTVPRLAVARRAARASIADSSPGLVAIDDPAPASRPPSAPRPAAAAHPSSPGPAPAPSAPRAAAASGDRGSVAPSAPRAGPPPSERPSVAPSAPRVGAASGDRGSVAPSAPRVGTAGAPPASPKAIPTPGYPGSPVPTPWAPSVASAPSSPRPSAAAPFFPDLTTPLGLGPVVPVSSAARAAHDRGSSPSMDAAQAILPASPMRAGAGVDASPLRIGTPPLGATPATEPRAAMRVPTPALGIAPGGSVAPRPPSWLPPPSTGGMIAASPQFNELPGALPRGAVPHAPPSDANTVTAQVLVHQRRGILPVAVASGAAGLICVGALGFFLHRGAARAPSPATGAKIAASAAPTPAAPPSGSAVASASSVASAAPAAGAPPAQPDAAAAVASSASAAPSEAAAPLPRYDKRKIVKALDGVAADLVSCAQPTGGPRGPGSIRIRIEPDGAISRVTIGPPYARSKVGACIVERFQAMHVDAYRGSPVAMNYVFSTIRW